MWPFSARRQTPDQAHLELVAQIHGLVQRVKQLEEDLAALQGAHERLRGRFYSLNGAGKQQGTKTKEQLLAEHFAKQRG